VTAIQELIPHVLLAAVLARSLVVTAIGVRYGGRQRRLLATGPGQRVRRYRRTIIESGLVAALIPAIVATSPSLTFADVGWRRPEAEGITYLLCAYFALVFAIGGVRLRRRMRRGGTAPGRAAMAPMVPQTRSERRWALGMAATVAITEEAVYRGLLIAAGIQLYHLPPAIAVVASLLFFLGIHAYQGRRAVLSGTLVSGLLTFLYLISNSLFPVIVLHFCIDVVSLLVIPAYPTAPADDQPDTAEAATDKSEQKLAGT
jgi:membrane protease YdiL (CAAX protease family)